MDFSLAIEGAGSARSFHTASPGTLQKRTELMLQLETDTKYISDLLTYTTLTVEDFSSNSFYTSTKEEMDATRRRITDTVHLQARVHISITLILQYYRNPRLLSLTRSSDCSQGSFFSSLEKILQTLNVKRQAYQGGTFVGNHVHKLLQVRITNILDINLLIVCQLF